ncbi:MAG: Minf_1886 family protein [Verrucomicrobiia bacterium]
MQKPSFSQIVSEIVERDARYDARAYAFVRDGLDYTIKMLKRSQSGTTRHVSGAELLDGLRKFTLTEFGPMGKLVLNEWGIHACEDFGNIVFTLVSHGVLGKSEADRPDDFSPGFSFDDAFVLPFLPAPTSHNTSPRRTKPGRKRKPRKLPTPPTASGTAE